MQLSRCFMSYSGNIKTAYIPKEHAIYFERRLSYPIAWDESVFRRQRVRVGYHAYI
jgi:hypothetical protein